MTDDKNKEEDDKNKKEETEKDSDKKDDDKNNEAPKEKEEDASATDDKNKNEAAKEKDKDISANNDDKKKEEESSADPILLEKMAERLKFFFSDANLRQDRFMRQLLLGNDKNKNVNRMPIETLLKFNTIKKLSTDPKIVARACREHCKDILVVVDDTHLARVSPFTMNQMDENIPLSLFVKNLPVTDNNYDCTNDELKQLFVKFGNVVMTKLRYKFVDIETGEEVSHYHHKKKKNSKRIASGSALVEFETRTELENAAEHVLTMKKNEPVTPKTKLVLQENTLEIVLLEEHVAQKKKQEAEQSSDKKRKRNEEEEQDDDKQDDDDNNNTKHFTLDWKPNCVIKLKGLNNIVNCDREALLDTVADGFKSSVPEIKARKIYVDYSRGQVDGAIRFQEPSDDIATLAEKLNKGELTVKGDKVGSAFVLSGEEETKYWNDFIEFKNKQYKHRQEEKHHKHSNNSRHKKKKYRK